MAVTVISGRLSRLFKFGFHFFSLISLALFCSEAISGNWQFVPRVESSLSYVDNINLAPEGDAESSDIFELKPGFSLTGEGRRLRARASYQLQSLYYSNNPLVGGGDDTDYFHRLSASANSELLERLLFFDASASISQQSSSAIGVGSLDNYSVSNERGTVNRTSLSPYIHHQLGNGLSTELRYRYDELDGDKNIVNNSIIQTTSLLMDSGRSANRWQWRVNARTSEVDYESESDQTHLLLDVSLNYHLLARTIVRLHGGTEKVKYHPSSVGTTGGDYWLLGVDWRPGRRTSISLQAGERYYGDTYGFSLKHDIRHGALGLDYKEDLTNRSLVQFEPGFYISKYQTTPEGDEVPVYGAALFPVLTTEVMLRKTLSGYMQWNHSKSTTKITLADTSYDYQTTGNSENTQSGEASWRWRTSKSMMFNLSAYYRHRKLSPTHRTESVDRLEMKLSRSLFKGADASFAVASTNRSTDISSQDYSQKRFTLALKMRW